MLNQHLIYLTVMEMLDNSTQSWIISRSANVNEAQSTCICSEVQYIAIKHGLMGLAHWGQGSMCLAHMGPMVNSYPAAAHLFNHTLKLDCHTSYTIKLLLVKLSHLRSCDC